MRSDYPADTFTRVTDNVDDIESELGYIVEYVQANLEGHRKADVVSTEETKYVSTKTDLHEVNWRGELELEEDNLYMNFEKNIGSSRDKDLSDLTVGVQGSSYNVEDLIITDDQDEIILMEIPDYNDGTYAILKVYTNGVQQEYRVCDIVYTIDTLDYTQIFG
jgi:hypothetical protein